MIFLPPCLRVKGEMPKTEVSQFYHYSSNFSPHVSEMKGKWLKMKCPKIIIINPNNSPTVAVLIQVIIFPPCLKDEGEMANVEMSQDYYYSPKQFPHCRGFIVNKFLFTILFKHVSNDRGHSQDHFDVFLSV